MTLKKVSEISYIISTTQKYIRYQFINAQNSIRLIRFAEQKQQQSRQKILVKSIEKLKIRQSPAVEMIAY
ncbi:hypothetical protein EB796_013301 [Bugula neritina]|uniref:Uncharacterized protein n=1 Tax=Bugula neritina TaxID=10212 RepID=A0A7J7JPY0_BUGNE|nr:hypothetical protein EB796_013301 [Bugula neritina]